MTTTEVATVNETNHVAEKAPKRTREEIQERIARLQLLEHRLALADKSLRENGFSPALADFMLEGETLLWPRPTEEQVAIHEELRTNLASLSNDATITPCWSEFSAKLQKLAATEPIEDFLQWTDYLSIREHDGAYRLWHAIRKHPEWKRWEKLARRVPWGNAHPLCLVRNGDPGVVATSNVHHEMRFEGAIGERFWENLDVVFEFGGGFGNACRMFREDGFRGSHVVLDQPVVREFQRAFLRLCGISVTTNVKLIDGCSLLTERDIPALIDLLRGKRVGFLATWSLSEAPLELRAKLFPALHPCCCKYLIAAQWPSHQREPHISNERYFTQFMQESGGAEFKIENEFHDVNWRKYLFGVRRP